MDRGLGEYRRILASPITEAQPGRLRSFLDGTRRDVRRIPPGEALIQQGRRETNFYTLVSGVAQLSLSGPDYTAPLTLNLPGDVLGLQNDYMAPSSYSVTANTSLTVLTLPREAFTEALSIAPDYLYRLTWLAAQEMYILGRLGTRGGQGRGPDRLAATLLYLFRRAESLGLTEGNQMRLSIKQADLAGLLGISLVHTNKSLRKLREMDLLIWRNGAMELLDRAALERFVGELPAFLFANRPVL